LDVGDDINQILCGNLDAQRIHVICMKISVVTLKIRPHVLGAQSVHIMSLKGTRLGQIKLDSTIAKAHVYDTDQKERILLLLVTEDNYYNIYEDTRLIWRAHDIKGHQPAFLSITSFKYVTVWL
jgi:hypothetical protein